MTLRVADGDWATGGYDRALAIERRRTLLAQLTREPGPTIGDLLAVEPTDEAPSADDIDAMIEAIYDARDRDLARRADGR